MIYWDLDGCIRDLASPLHGGSAPMSWSQPLPNGWDICAYISDNKHILTECPPTEYYGVAKGLPSISIISCQPESWRPFTTRWIRKHFDMATTDITYVDNGRDKLALLAPEDLLIEDYPLFEDYSQIILLNQPYNREVLAPYVRIYDKIHLATFLINYERFSK